VVRVRARGCSFVMRCEMFVEIFVFLIETALIVLRLASTKMAKIRTGWNLLSFNN
jgi:hypothetical protein